MGGWLYANEGRYYITDEGKVGTPPADDSMLLRERESARERAWNHVQWEAWWRLRALNSAPTYDLFQTDCRVMGRREETVEGLVQRYRAWRGLLVRQPEYLM